MAAGLGANAGAGMTVGVVGVGNMGSALVKGWLRTTQAAPAEVGSAEADGAAPGVKLLVWDKVEAATQRLLAAGSSTDRISAAASLEELVAKADVVLVVVKPKDAEEVLRALAGVIRREQVLVSAMTGIMLHRIRDIVGPGPTLLRLMPNLGVELGVGAVAVAAEPGASSVAVEEVIAILQPLGLVEKVSEDLFDAVTAVSGSGPAFLALAVEGLEDGAVGAGLSRSEARSLVRRSAIETAGLLPQHSDSAAELRRHLVSTREIDDAAMGVLEDRKVCSAFRRAVEAAVERSRQLRKA